MAIQREQVVRNAEKYASRGRIDAAIREYRKVLAEAPDDVATLNRVGDLYARADRNDEAIKLYVQIAESYTAEGFFVKAIAIFKKIIKLDPTRLEIYERLASLYHRQGLLNEARTQYQVLADYYLKHDNPTSAIAIYERLAEVDPNDPSLRVKLADLYREMKLLDRALGEYRRIAETMLAAGHPGEAEQVYRRALDVDASDIGFITDAVLKLREAGEVGPAARLLAQAVELNPQAAQVARLVGLAQPGARGGGAAVEEPAVEEPAVEGQEQAVEDREEEAVEAPAADAADATEPEEASPLAAPEEGEEALVLDLDADEALPPIELDLGSGPDAAEAVADAGAVEEEPADAGEPAPPAAAAPEPEPPAPAAASPFGEELELDLDEVFVLDFDEDEEPPDTQVRPPPDLAGSSEPAAALRDRFAARPGGALGFDPDALERTAAEIQPERIRQEEDLLTEAEVLSKYGLAEKAAERLGELLEINPTHVGGLALEVRFHLDAGRHAAAAASAERLRTIADEQSEAWRKTVEHLEAAGHEVSGDRVVPPADDVVAEAEDALADAEDAAPPDDDAVTLPGAQPGEERAEPRPAAFDAASAEEVPAEDASLDDDPFAGLEDIDLSGLPGMEEDAPPTPPANAPQAAAPPPEPAESAEPAEPTEPIVGAGTPARPPRRERSDVDSVLAELASGLGRRRRKDRRQQASPPPTEPPPTEEPVVEPTAADRALAQPPAAEQPAAEPPAGASPPAAASAAAPSPPPAETDSEAEAVGWLQEVERATGRIGQGVDGDGDGDGAATVEDGGGGGAFFSAEEDFFDLAAELEDELSREGELDQDELLLAQPKEQTLEEIVDGFKRGVSETLSPEDYATHYELGIAYREMGLLDEAIGEFQIAAKDPALLVSCCSMLGLSFLDKGLPELAIKWYRRGLEVPGATEEDQLGLLYDLGNAHLATNDREAAYRTFVDLYGINSHYRDVVARLEDTRPRE